MKLNEKGITVTTTLIIIIIFIVIILFVAILAANFERNTDMDNDSLDSKYIIKEVI